MRLPAFVACLTILAFPALASAQSPSLDLRGFRAPTDPNAGMYLEPAASPGTLDFNAAVWLSYAHRPVTLRDAATGDLRFAVVGSQLTSDLTMNVGIAERLALGLDMPFLVYQSGDTPTADSRAVLGHGEIPGGALGDLGLVAKLTLLKPTGGEFGGFAVALHERFTLPTGDQESYLGEGHVTSETRLLGEYRLVAFAVHANAGVKLRGEQERFACGTVPEPAAGDDPCLTRFGHEIPFGLGLSLRPQALGIDTEGRWTWFLETRGHLPLAPIAPFDSGRVARLSAALGARYAMGDFSIFGGVEAPIVAGVGVPAVRGVLSLGWAPRTRDRDADGIPDDIDQCPDLPEDRDGFEDADGCPEGDNDDDGVPDADDRCPTEKEDEDGFQDDDGCPDPDNDGDGIADDDDACPNEAGPASADPKRHGCPVRDADGDGIADAEDACPNEPGAANADPKRHGCPTPPPEPAPPPETESPPGTETERGGVPGGPVRDGAAVPLPPAPPGPLLPPTNPAPDAPPTP